jgi:hypothetical protein
VPLRSEEQVGLEYVLEVRAERLVRQRVSRIVLQLVVVVLAVSGCGGGTAPERRSESLTGSPSGLQIRAYENEYGVCAGSTLAEIKRASGLDQADVTPREAILKMEQETYWGPLRRFAFEGCWDGYRGRPQRYGVNE